MSRTKDPEIEERNRRLVEDVRENGMKPYDELSRKHGMSDSLIYRCLSEANIVTQEARAPRAKFAARTPVSNLHLFWDR